MLLKGGWFRLIEPKLVGMAADPGESRECSPTFDPHTSVHVAGLNDHGLKDPRSSAN